ncbi:MAG: molecular chaperone HtpG, partial [Clostridia bacterium]|nr:molecular chaperone HtpG [Clostridia bacterium]
MKQFKAESKRVLDMMINSIYTNKEIFLRELISNCSDAMDKLYYKSLNEGLSGLNRNDMEISVSADKDARTITISDMGIGMTAEELEKNLGVIAQSDSFVFKKEDIKNDDINIIGQFGVGFYSAFMVSDKVEVLSKAYGSDKANLWVSTGVEGYDITPSTKDTHGTTITLHIKPNTENDNYDEFLDNDNLCGLVKKYSDYIKYPIKMKVHSSTLNEEGKRETHESIETVNSMVPLWKKQKSEITNEEYDAFYRNEFNEAENIAHMHLSIEGTVDYKALLFIPKNVPYNYYSKDYVKGLKLYTNGVLITEKCGDLLPDYFGFVKGIVDTDIPLNIIRETIKQNRQLKTIAKKIEKKIKEELL